MNLTAIRTALADARNVAHDATAIVAVAAGSAGAIASGLDAVGLHVGSPDVAHVAFVAGLAVGVVSKGIDSLNDALKGLFGAGQAATPPTPRPTVVPHG